MQIILNLIHLFRNIDILDNEDDKETLEKIDEVIQTNFTGLVHVTRKGYRLIEKSDDYGIIINIGSVAGHSIPNVPFKFNVIFI